MAVQVEYAIRDGRPIVGDTLYGGKLISEFDLTGAGSTDPLLHHQALHAWQISFRHPITENEMSLEAPFPPELRRLVTILREHRRA